MQRQKLLKIFLDESEDLITELEDGLVALEVDPQDAEQINRVFRAAHTMKGNAGLTGITRIVEFTHVMEGVLDRVRDGTVHVTPTLATALLDSVDVLRVMVDLVGESRPLDKVPGFERSIDSLRRFLGVASDVDAGANGDAEPEEDQSTRYYEIRMQFRDDILETGQDPALLVEELSDVGTLHSVDLNLSALPKIDSLDPYQMYLAWRIVLETTEARSALDNLFIFVSDENDITIHDVTERFRDGVDMDLAEKKLGEILVERGAISEKEVNDALGSQRRTGELLVQAGHVSEEVVDEALKSQQAARQLHKVSSIRVDTSKLDSLINLVGELVVNVARINQVLTEGDAVDGEERLSAQESLNRVSRDLQEQVMGVRMVPVDATFNRFRRVVRDTATELGKQVNLVMEGTETELDKNVIEQLADPLKHLVRNAVDHGIEMPDTRRAAGKPEAGTLTLRASQREGNIVIEIIDDGGGIDTNAVLAKAREEGLVGSDDTPEPSAIHDLLFQPGFSTAAKVTTISGRGVGLDVVRRNIEDLRGSVQVRSKPGEGTTFRITLPLTLAIIEGMKVRVGEEILTIPLLSIIEQLRPRPAQLKMVAGKGEVVLLRGEYLPLVRLHDVFGLHAEHTNPTEALVVVIENNHKKYSVLVDEVLGQEQAVVKSLDNNYRDVKGVAGATILGDGRISLIVDVHGVERMALA